MKITLCGSIAFYDEMLSVRDTLEKLGHEVKLPPSEIFDEIGKKIPVKEYYDIRKSTNSTSGWIWDRKEEAIRLHFGKIEWCEAILVLNYTKNGIENYIGANTLIEIGLAFHLKKKIFLLHPTPKMQYSEEIFAMKPVVIEENFSLLQAV